MLQTSILLTVMIMAMFGGIVLLIVSPLKSTRMFLSPDVNLNPTLEKLTKMFGGDILSFISNEKINKSVRMNRLEKLFNTSGNPWSLTFTEFIVLQYILGFVGIIGGVVFGALTYYAVGSGMMIVAIVVAVVIPLLGFNYPKQYYNSLANTRENQFKAQLPEAIDYLILALSGGSYSLPTAFEETLKYMPNNLMREEFVKIVGDLRSGKTMENALMNFAERSPTEGIKAFAKALNNANKLSVSQVDILRSRATESRRALENEIDKRIATLDSKVTMIFSPTSAISLGIVVIAPTMYTLTQLM